MLFYAEFGYIRDKYYEDLAKQIDPATIEVFKDYSSNLNVWAHWRIRWIDKMHIIFLLEKLQRERQKANDLRMTIKILNGIFEWAKKHGFVFANPCDDLTDEAAIQILDSINEFRDQSIEAYGEVHSYWAYPPDETKILLDKFGLSVEYIADMTDNKYDSIRRWFSNKKRMPEKLRKLVLGLVNPANPVDAIVVSQPSAQFGKNMEFLRKAIGWLDRGEEYTKIELAEIFRSTHYTVAAWNMTSCQHFRASIFWQTSSPRDFTPRSPLPTSYIATYPRNSSPSSSRR
jgi:hypothetical protein